MNCFDVVVGDFLSDIMIANIDMLRAFAADVICYCDSRLIVNMQSQRTVTWIVEISLELTEPGSSF